MRAALLLTGHLRSTCDGDGQPGLHVVAQHVAACHSAFEHCDVFLHTWDRLDKAPAYRPQPDDPAGPLKPKAAWFRKCGFTCRFNARAAQTSSWPCVANLTGAIASSGGFAAVTVERQDRAIRAIASASTSSSSDASCGTRTSRGTRAQEASTASPHAASRSRDELAEDRRPWGLHGETLRNFRLNGASMASGAALVARHMRAMGHTYDAAVRMRADAGSYNMLERGAFKDQFLTNIRGCASGRTPRRNGRRARAGRRRQRTRWSAAPPAAA